MPILAAFGTWLLTMLVGLGIIMLLLFALDSAGVSSDAQQVISFILGMPVGVVGTLLAFHVYDRLTY